MYQVTIRPIKIGDRIYRVGEKIDLQGKEVDELIKQGYLKQVKEKKDGKKTH